MAQATRQLRPADLDEQQPGGDVAGETTHGKIDPKPDPVAVSEGRIHELVTTIDVEVRKHWGETRDTMDTLMRAYEERGLRIEAEVRDYTAEGEQLINSSKIMRDGAQALVREIGQRRPATLTVLQPRGERR